MLKSNLLLALCCILPISVVSADTLNSERQPGSSQGDIHGNDSFAAQSTFGTPKEFATRILENSKDSLESRLGSVLANQLFGGLGNSSVSLSDESLTQIDNIVRKALLDSDYYEVQGILSALNAVLENFHENAANDYFNANLLDSLILESNKLISHRVFNPGHNPNHYLYVKTYMMIAALSVAVDTEQYLRGFVSKRFVQNRAAARADKLRDLKNRVVQYSYNNFRLTQCRPNGYEVACTFEDLIKGQYYTRSYHWEEEYEAREYETYMRNYYITQFSGGVDEVILMLDNI